MTTVAVGCITRVGMGARVGGMAVGGCVGRGVSVATSTVGVGDGISVSVMAGDAVGAGVSVGTGLAVGGAVGVGRPGATVT
jgi:hypothetical protein